MPGSSIPAFFERKCSQCTYYSEEHDGEYGEIFCGSSCSKPGNERYANLKSFPFKNEQPCFVEEFWFSKYTDLVEEVPHPEYGWDISLDKAIAAWREQWKHKLDSNP